MNGNKSEINIRTEQRDMALIEKVRPPRSYRIKVVGFGYRTVSITTKLRRCISPPGDPSSLHTSFRQMPFSRYHLSLAHSLSLHLSNDVITYTTAHRRRFILSTKTARTTVSNRDDDGKSKEERTEGREGKLSTSRKRRGIQKVSHSFFFSRD